MYNLKNESGKEYNEKDSPSFQRINTLPITAAQTKLHNTHDTIKYKV